MRPSMVVDRETLERFATFSLVAVEDDFPVGYRESLVPHDQPSLLIQQVLNRGRPVLLGDCLHKLVLRLVSRQRREGTESRLHAELKINLTFLERLAESGLVVVTKVGNQKHYQANEDSPLFEELRSIISKTVGLQEPLRATLDPLADRISLAIIYGSIAKGREKAASDVDLLIVADRLTLEEVYAVLAPVEKVLDRRINPKLYTRRVQAAAKS